MGNRGYKAGGFAHMQRVKCPNCGLVRPLGKWSISVGMTQCTNKTKCEERRKRKHG